MEQNQHINFTFNIPGEKEWTLLNDKLLIGKKEILLSKIQAVEIFSQSNIEKNGVIVLTVGRKFIGLAYANKDKENAEKAIEYLQGNYGRYKNPNDRKREICIRDEINSLPYTDLKATTKEVIELSFMLGTDEHIKAMTRGVTNNEYWMIICTNIRILMLSKDVFYRLKSISIPLDRINSISYSKVLIFAKLVITDGASTRGIENVSNITVKFFVDTVNKEIEMYKQAKNTLTTQVINAASTADELLKFKQLLDMGVLTQAEFDVKKKELLGL